MITLLYILTALAFLYVLFTLVVGAMTMGGKSVEKNEKSNKWMQRRVLGQAVAIGLLFLTVYVQRQVG